MNNKKYQHIFGPVPSRRLGFSLGIDLVPFKTCSFDCIYCQIERTTNHTLKRKSFFPYQEVISELLEKLKGNEHIDYITFSGSGEPTLNSDIGTIINKIKTITSIPVSVITNSSLLYQEEVISDLKNADLLIPSLDAVTEETFKKINRPGTEVILENVLQGLINIKNWFSGEVRLEIMLLKDINDSAKEIEKLVEMAAKIKPDKIELNSVVRPPVENFAKAIAVDKLEAIAKQFGTVCSVITAFDSINLPDNNHKQQALILTTLKRRPLTINELQEITGLHIIELTKQLEHLKKETILKETEYNNQIYYQL